MFELNTNRRRIGYSPLIGLILTIVMVIILIVLLSVYIIGIGDINKESRAVIDVDHNPGTSVEIQLVSIKNTDQVSVRTKDNSQIHNPNNPLTESGEIMVIEGPSYNHIDTIYIIGERGNNATVLEVVELSN